MYVSRPRSSQLAAKDGHSASAADVRSARIARRREPKPANRTSSTMTEISPLIERSGRRSDVKSRDGVPHTTITVAWRFSLHCEKTLDPESPVAGTSRRWTSCTLYQRIGSTPTLGTLIRFRHGNSDFSGRFSFADEAPNPFKCRRSEKIWIRVPRARASIIIRRIIKARKLSKKVNPRSEPSARSLKSRGRYQGFAPSQSLRCICHGTDDQSRSRRQ